MAETNASIWKSSFMWGVYIAIVLILVSVVFYVTGNPFSKVGNYVNYPVWIAGIVLAQLGYRKMLDGYVTYGQAVGMGVLAALFGSIIMGIYVYLLYTVIDPSLQEQLRLFTEQQIIEQGSVPEGQMEMVLEMSTKFQKPAILAGMSVVMNTLLGLVISLITAIFVKKNVDNEVPA